MRVPVSECTLKVEVAKTLVVHNHRFARIVYKNSVSAYVSTESEKNHVPNASQSWLGHRSLVLHPFARPARSYRHRLGAQCKRIYQLLLPHLRT